MSGAVISDISSGLDSGQLTSSRMYWRRIPSGPLDGPAEKVQIKSITSASVG